jgi:hypothetical protein
MLFSKQMWREAQAVVTQPFEPETSTFAHPSRLTHQAALRRHTRAVKQMSGRNRIAEIKKALRGSPIRQHLRP